MSAKKIIIIIARQTSTQTGHNSKIFPSIILLKFWQNETDDKFYLNLDY